MTPTIDNQPVSTSPILATRFDLALALQLGSCAVRAYSEATVICTKTDTQVLILDGGDCTVLAFRGTSSLRDWLTDAQFFKKPISSDVLVHHGFLDAIDSILPMIIDALLPAGADKSKVKPLKITGHSLGGALAPLAAVFLSREGFNIQAVYTFASPRVGNAGWRDAYNRDLGDRTFRLVAAGDLVPLIPGIFCPPRDGYRHVGTEVYLDGGAPIVAPSRLFEIACDTWRAYRAIKRADYDFILQFHSMAHDYLPLLNA